MANFNFCDLTTGYKTKNTWTGDFKLPLDMNVSVNSCLPFCVDPAVAWRSIQHVPNLSPYRSSSYPAMLKIT